MANGTMKKTKAYARKGMSKVEKANGLKSDEEDDVTRIPVVGVDGEMRPISERTETESTNEPVELIFGINAGVIWESLNLEGPMTVDDLVKTTALPLEDIHGALGWLGRENKISVKRQGTERVYSLRP